jgi:hypothetical protein
LSSSRWSRNGQINRIHCYVATWITSICGTEIEEAAEHACELTISGGGRAEQEWNDRRPGSHVVRPAVVGAAGGAAVVVAASLVAGMATGGEPEPEPGPIRPPNVHVWGHKAEVGEAFTDGLETISLPGRRSAVLKSLELVADPEIELVGVELVEPGRKYGTIQQLPWPARDPDLDRRLVVPAEGATILPRSQVGSQGYELLIGMRGTEEGYFVRKGLWIRYVVDGTEYRRYYPAVLSVCSGNVHRDERFCPEPEGWQEFAGD